MAARIWMVEEPATFLWVAGSVAFCSFFFSLVFSPPTPTAARRLTERPVEALRDPERLFLSNL